MRPNDSEEIFLVVAANPLTAHARRSRFVSFVPITLALLGVGAILFGQVSARTVEITGAPEVDTVVTGSIQIHGDQRRAMELLDR